MCNKLCRVLIALLNKKGQIRTLEAFLAVLIIFSTSIISVRVSVPANFESRESLWIYGMQALIELDDDGYVGKLIEEKNWTTIRENINILLPPGVSYNVIIYDEAMNKINESAISNDPNGKDVVSIDYPCASQSSECHLYLIRLQLSFAG